MSSFEPATLPLVMVVNRDAELKARLEQDDADRRMSTAALMLARQFASKSNSRRRCASTSTLIILR